MRIDDLEGQTWSSYLKEHRIHLNEFILLPKEYNKREVDISRKVQDVN